MKRKPILLVDNNPLALKMLADVLKALQFSHMEQATSANVAWRMLKLNPYAGVIAQMEMPEMSGLSLLKIIRSDERLYDIPFFLMHAAFTKSKVLIAGQEGVTGLIVKPFDIDLVREKLSCLTSPPTTKLFEETRRNLEKGLKLLEAGEYEEALAVFEKMIEEGESAEVYFNIGFIKTAQGKYEEALKAFQKATELDRLIAKAYEAMGRIYQTLGNDRDAKRFLQKAADIYLAKENIGDEEEIINEILLIRPDTVNVYNSLGVLYRKKGEFKRALTSYQKALRIHPNQPQIHYNIGRLLQEMKDTDGATKQFEKALNLDPDFQEAREILEAIQLGTV